MLTESVLKAVRHDLVNPGLLSAHVVVAVSGGTDSTALLLLLAALRDEGCVLSCAHVNHHLRGVESDEDESFVRDLCTRLAIELDIADGTLDPDVVRARGIEAAAREVRYARLEEIRVRRNAQWIATAHQKNDQAETVLMRLMTSSGIAGLRGIPPQRDHIIRPLLNVTRAQLEQVLREHDITAREDRSNTDQRFLRNRVRKLVHDLNLIDDLIAIADDARALWPILEQTIDAADRTCATIDDHATHFIALPENNWLRGALLQRHIRRLDPAARDYDARAIDVRSSRVSVTKHLELVRNANGWTLHQRARAARRVPPLTIHFALATRQPPTANRQLIQLPANAQPTFTVRTRQPGDTFHPLGMPAPKKLKDFLIDRKIARERRDRLPLLLWNGEIVWIAGVEVSERFKVTSPARGTLYEVWLEGSGADDADHSPVHR